jgi:hypothetical protein
MPVIQHSFLLNFLISHINCPKEHTLEGRIVMAFCFGKFCRIMKNLSLASAPSPLKATKKSLQCLLRFLIFIHTSWTNSNCDFVCFYRDYDCGFKVFFFMIFQFRLFYHVPCHHARASIRFDCKQTPLETSCELSFSVYQLLEVTSFKEC